jgi:hypothetical protein
LRILYGLAADGLTNNKSIPKNLTHTALLINMSDMNAPGFLTWIFPLLRWIAKGGKGEARRAKINTAVLLKHFHQVKQDDAVVTASFFLREFMLISA